MSMEFIDDSETEVFMEVTKTLTLTRNEALFIDNNVTLMLEAETEHGGISSIRTVVPSAVVAVPLDLIEKVGMAILATTDPDRELDEYTVEFSLSELFTIREICTSFIKVGSERVGWNLKRKVYSALLGTEYKERKAFESLVKDVPFPSWDMESDTEAKKSIEKSVD